MREQNLAVIANYCIFNNFGLSPKYKAPKNYNVFGGLSGCGGAQPPRPTFARGLDLRRCSPPHRPRIDGNGVLAVWGWCQFSVGNPSDERNSLKWGFHASVDHDL